MYWMQFREGLLIPGIAKLLYEERLGSLNLYPLELRRMKGDFI